MGKDDLPSADRLSRDQPEVLLAWTDESADSDASITDPASGDAATGPPGGARPWTSGRIVVAAVVAALVVIGLVSLINRDRRGSAAPPRPSPSATLSLVAPSPNGSPADSFVGLSQTGKVCAEQKGRRVTVGIELTNVEINPIRVTSWQADLPLAGLHQESIAHADCRGRPFGQLVSHGQSLWIQTVFTARVSCVAPLPVRFRVFYTTLGVHRSTLLVGFDDLALLAGQAGCTH
ncbi:hypothetical protein M6D93_14310 [Jatrophihabitans telluris]|uniref:DUF4352 domain-containing protein n=1 Tax=Jatrophihabitans telluris TaxID=2038343 RepID=A0ABY4QUY2_9ACTN|nr:hypothetical protein [Jatrophihabitans telluris]UQX87468.1 hypothetical protein M6D93_14310 [Jatrophihabitans telluris]